MMNRTDSPNRFGTWMAAGLTVVALAGAPAFADPVEDEQLLEEDFAFALAPGATMIDFPQFDPMGGSRQLQEVTLFVDAGIAAGVTVENDSVLPAPDLAVNIAGFMTIDFETLSMTLTFDATELSDGNVMGTDGVPGSGPDFYDFGTFGDSDSDTDVMAIPDDLSAFIGLGTVTADIFATGGFSVSGASDSTITISNFGAAGEVSIIYGYKAVPGACCFPDGSCDVMSLEDCETAGGEYQGPDVTCTAADCPQPGACCFADGSCQDVANAAACTALGGDYQGDGTMCASVNCPQPGACCFEDGSCQDVANAAACTALGGAYQGDGTNCATTDCPQTGACCLPDGSCIEVGGGMPSPLAGGGAGTGMGSRECEALGGEFQGEGSNCNKVKCPAPGACCFDDGSCEELEAEACTAAGGDFVGVGVMCSVRLCDTGKIACCFPDASCAVRPAEACIAAGGVVADSAASCVGVVCDEPPAACCFADGSCDEMVQSDCNAQGGFYQGDFSTCANVECLQPQGACCLADGDCAVFTEMACVAAGGTPMPSANCVGVDCPEQVAACCYEDGDCEMVLQDECNATGGLWQGEGSTCADVDCPQPSGACCMVDGLCTILSQAECVGGGGFYAGDYTVCDGAGCLLALPAVYVVSDADNLTVEEQMIIDLLDVWDFEVTTISASATPEALADAMNGVRVALVAAGVETELPAEFTDGSFGIVNEAAALIDDFGFAATTDDAMWLASVEIADAHHALTAAFELGAVALFDVPQPMRAVPAPRAPGADVLADLSDTAVVLALDAGAETIAGGPAAGRRVHLPWAGSHPTEFTPAGRALLRAALLWAGSTASAMTAPDTGADEPPFGDVNGDGAVDTNDVADLMGDLGDCGLCPSDLDGDGDVDADDLKLLLMRLR